MALHLNLLHEEILEQRRRQRDPLKIGLFILVAIGALMVAYYMWNVYRTLAIKSRLSALNHNWEKVEPKVTAAQKRVTELNGVIKTTRALDDYIDNRFYWAPFLQKIAQCVAPNTQLTTLTGSATDDKGVEVTLEGIAAGQEPRSVAEDFRQMLLEQLKEPYGEPRVEFRSLEDLDQVVMVGGSHMAVARYAVVISFKPNATRPIASPAPGKPRRK
jgi:hypothetical protein